MQHTSHLLMIRPVNFNFNTETAINNSFQKKTEQASVHSLALIEFDRLVAVLREQGLNVIVVNDTPEPYTPDSVFPNNWISFHESGDVFLYPMFAPNRRMERKNAVTEMIFQKFMVRQLIDLSHHENDHQFLEGTGSMVLDRENHLAYACLSPRTNQIVLEDFCNRTGYTPIVFNAVDINGDAIYHTNVMMCVADEYAVICLESITQLSEKKQVIEMLQKTNKQMIDISHHQMNRFAGNMLQVHNNEGKRFLVMSSNAYHSLSSEQVHKIEMFNPIIHSDINTIETNGGGSARCMIAEIFLQKNPEN